MANYGSASPVAGNVGRPAQTTTAQTGGGPFIRYARTAVQQGYGPYAPGGTTAGAGFGSLVNLPLQPVPGFLRALKIRVVAQNGSGTATVAMNADAPFNAIASLILRDPSGEPIVNLDGFALMLANKYGGQIASAGFQDPRTWPGYSAPVTGVNGSGNFTFELYVPLTLNSSAYCSLPADNSAAVPTLSLQMNQVSQVYATAPTNAPYLTVTVSELYYATPANMPDIAPFDVGASAQWTVSQSSMTVPSNASGRLMDQAVGQFVHSKIYVVRDSTGARVAVFPTSDLSLWIDSFQYRIETKADRDDLVYHQFGVNQANDTGVVAYSWRRAVSQLVTDADDNEELLPTTPATKLEVGGTWGNVGANSPAQLTVITGWVFPGPSGYPYGAQG